MTEQNETAFRAPVKWEQNFCCHSPGHIQLTKHTVEFIPHKVMSVIGKQLVIPIESIREVRFGDNFLWRGVVHIFLHEPIRNREKYIFFLGSKRRNFMETFEKSKEKQ